MNMSSWVIIIFFLLSMGLGYTYFENGVTQEEVYNTTYHLQWNSSKFPIEQIPFSNNTHLVTHNRLYNVMIKFIDFVGFTGFEFAKWGIETGYNHPDMNYLKLAKFMIYFMIFMAAYSVFICVCALIYVIKDAVIGGRKWLKKRQNTKTR